MVYTLFPETLKLMKEDLTEIIGTSQPDKPASCVTDEEFALAQWKKEVDDAEAAFRDRQLAVRVALLPRDDATAISAILKEEERARTDRQVALRMSGNQAPEHQSPPTLYQQQMCRVIERIVTDDAKPKLKRRAADPSTDEHEHGPKQASFECVACGEQGIFFKMIEAPCSHYYCQACLIQLFEAALRDESLFPPRCCRILMPLESVRTLVGPDTSRRTEKKIIEINDPSRTYCSKQTCSAYIFSSQKQNNCGTCQECGQKTCLLCKNEYHQGKCVQTPDPIHQLAEVEGWKRCSRCKHLVELDTGCNHITCRCRYEFCYVCSKRWRTCRCLLWDERRLLERANQIAARINPILPAAAVNDVVEALQGGDECDHQRMKSVSGEFECEGCNEDLAVFIYECRNCQIHLCKRCRRNRA